MIYKVCRGCNKMKQIYSNGYCRPCYRRNVNICLDDEKYKSNRRVRPSIIHVYIYNKLKDNCEMNGNILSRDFVKIVFLRSHIPNLIHNDFLSEMEELGLVKLTDKRNIEIVV